MPNRWLLVAALAFVPLSALAQTGWVDDFESYRPYSFPSGNWRLSGSPAPQVIYQDQPSGHQDPKYRGDIVSGHQSLEFSGPGNCYPWPLAYRSLAIAAPLTVEFYARQGSGAMSNCSYKMPAFALTSEASWQATSVRGLGGFDATGVLHAGSQYQGTPLGTFEPMTWVKVRVSYERPDAKTVKLTYRINDQAPVVVTETALAGEGQIAWLMLSGGDGADAWIDDVSVSPGTSPGGRPVACTYTLTPGPVSFSAAGGTGAMGGDTSDVRCTWTATSDADWLGISANASGVGAAKIKFTVSPNPSPGQRAATVHFGDQSAVITQTGSGPMLQTSQRGFSFVGSPGDTGAGRQTVQVSSGGLPMAFTARATTASGGGWLTVTPSDATTPATLTATVSPGGMSLGTYEGTITVNAPGAALSTIALPVRMAVLPPGRLSGNQYIISTLAGAFDPDDGAGSAVAKSLSMPTAVAVDKSLNVYIADTNGYRIRKVSPDGTIRTIAGTGIAGFTTHEGAALGASMGAVYGLAVDAAGNVYVADRSNHRIRRITPDGYIKTVAGCGAAGFGGDGGSALDAYLNAPYGVAVDRAGNLYFSDGNRIRKITAEGTISTVAGTGSAGFSGDGGPATLAALNGPTGLAVDATGNLYVADTSNKRIRKIAPNGVIQTVAGGGLFRGDHFAATSAELIYPMGLAVDTAGNIYISHWGLINMVTPDGMFWILAGTQDYGFQGDGGRATSALFRNPWGLTADTAGNVYIADAGNNRIRKVAANGVVQTIAGNGAPGFAGDGGPAGKAFLQTPEGVAVDSGGNVYAADSGNHRVRRIGVSGSITTVAGSGNEGRGADNQYATATDLDTPSGVAVDARGNLYLADSLNQVTRRLSADGVLRIIAGNGTAGSAGDGAQATTASLSAPIGLALDLTGSLYIADRGNSRIRKITIDGVIRTVAGGPQSGFGGDGGPAISASLSLPRGVAVDASGTIYIADTGNHRVRSVSPDGTIRTLAGDGVAAFRGDGGPAPAASLNAPAAVAVDFAGNVYIADSGNHRIRKVAADGTIVTIAGDGYPTFDGDGGPATLASLNAPSGIVVDAEGSIYIADHWNHRIRKLAPVSDPAAVPCSFSLHPGIQSVWAAAAAGTFAVSASRTDCQWTATSGSPYLTVAPAGGGKGSGTLTFEIPTNPQPTPRTTTLTIGGRAASVTQAAAGSPVARVVVRSAASYFPTVAPDSLGVVYGSGVAARTAIGAPDATGLLPSDLAGTSVEVNGLKAPLVFVSPDQINCLVPAKVETGGGKVSVKADGVEVATGALDVALAAPALFAADGSGQGPAAALNAVTWALPPFAVQTAENPGSDKRTRVAVYGSGIRYAGNPGKSPGLNVSANIVVDARDPSGKAVSLPVEYAGPAPGFAGLDQVNLVLPPEVNSNMSLSLRIAVSGRTSNSVSIPLRQITLR